MVLDSDDTLKMYIFNDITHAQAGHSYFSPELRLLRLQSIVHVFQLNKTDQELTYQIELYGVCVVLYCARALSLIRIQVLIVLLAGLSAKGKKIDHTFQ